MICSDDLSRGKNGWGVRGNNKALFIAATTGQMVKWNYF